MLSWVWTSGDMPAAAYRTHTDCSPETPLLLRPQPQADPFQTPKVPHTQAAALTHHPASTSSWPVLTPSSGQTGCTKLQTGLTNLHSAAQSTTEVQWVHAEAATAAPRRISFGGSAQISSPVTSDFQLATQAEGQPTLSSTALPSTDAPTTQQQSDRSIGLNTRKRVWEADESGRSQRIDGTSSASFEILPTSDRAVKRRKKGMRLLHEHPQVSDAALKPPTRELRAMTSIKGSGHRTDCSPRLKPATGSGEEATGLERQAMIVMETSIQQLQSELKVS